MYNKNLPLVSVYCDTYNQKDYIEDALRGFLDQKTNFKFEIIIHDDASVDGTQEIIKEYAKRYPETINLVIEHENKYSKHIDFTHEIIMKLSSKYVAFCDGDDYWIDDNKLQMQVNYMETHLDCVCCGTEAQCINDVTGENQGLFWGLNQDCLVDPDLILEGERLVMKPSSWMIRVKPLQEGQKMIGKLGGNSDFPLNLWMVSAGNIYYLHKPMIVYRCLTKGSWSENVHNLKIDYYTEVIDILKRFNEETSYRYNEKIKKAITRWKYSSIASGWGDDIKTLKLSDWFEMYRLCGMPLLKRAFKLTPCGQIVYKIHKNVKSMINKV